MAKTPKKRSRANVAKSTPAASVASQSKRLKNSTGAVQSRKLTESPPVPVPESQASAANVITSYKSYIVFVNDPKLQRPFTVLQSCNIQCLELKSEVNNHFLNNRRRKRRYDVAFTNLFTFPCRVFAKAENSVTAVKLHKICGELNKQFHVLMACKVSVDTAYDRLLDANPRKVKDGVIYETGQLESHVDESQLLPDTASSYSNMGDSQRLYEDNNGGNVSKSDDDNNSVS